MDVATLEWCGDLPGRVEMIDQTLLPTRFEIRTVDTPESMWEAIRSLRVRGAPAIGVAAAYGLVLGVQHFPGEDRSAFRARLEDCDRYLRTARPTAVNLFWALDRMAARAAQVAGETVARQKRALLDEARAILDEDLSTCRAIGRHGASLITEGSGALTHCNAGGLATGRYGTALSLFYAAHAEGRSFRVYADETRPLLQGARLTAWELARAGIDVTLICDNMAGVVMREGKVQCVVVGADRIAANGDTANKIGTYTVSILAAEHGIPFYVAAPTSTFDLDTADGRGIPIEERPGEEITAPGGVLWAPEGVKVYNPAFDVTPHEKIAGIVTEFGIVERPDKARIRAFFETHRPDRLDPGTENRGRATGSGAGGTGGPH